MSLKHSDVGSNPTEPTMFGKFPCYICGMPDVYEVTSPGGYFLWPHDCKRSTRTNGGALGCNPTSG